MESNQLSRKLEEERVHTASLRSDLKQTQKALVLEVGEDVPLEKVCHAYCILNK